MDGLSLIAVAVALAMDAFAVALAAGVVLRPLCFRPCFRLAFHFGLFQALMPVIGWLASGAEPTRYRPRKPPITSPASGVKWP